MKRLKIHLEMKKTINCSTYQKQSNLKNENLDVEEYNRIDDIFRECFFK